MARLEWDKTGERLYEVGVSNGVLYPAVNGEYPKGVVWNGLTNVTEKPTGAEPSKMYADNIKYFNILSAEEYEATIEAYYSPKEFDACDGTAELVPGVKVGQQNRQTFGFCYKTLIGSDTEGENKGYKLHLVYGCMASPSEKTHESINDSPDLSPLSWEVTTTPVNISAKGFKPTATIEIDSTEFTEDKMEAIEDVLYGTETDEARLPLPDEVADIMK